MDIDAQMHPSLHLWMNVSYMVWVDTKDKGLKKARPIGRGPRSQPGRTHSTAIFISQNLSFFFAAVIRL